MKRSLLLFFGLLVCLSVHASTETLLSGITCSESFFSDSEYECRYQNSRYPNYFQQDSLTAAELELLKDSYANIVSGEQIVFTEIIRTRYYTLNHIAEQLQLEEKLGEKYSPKTPDKVKAIVIRDLMQEKCPDLSKVHSVDRREYGALLMKDEHISNLMSSFEEDGNYLLSEISESYFRLRILGKARYMGLYKGDTLLLKFVVGPYSDPIICR